MRRHRPELFSAAEWPRPGFAGPFWFVAPNMARGEKAPLNLVFPGILCHNRGLSPTG
jgi:hypothetical protein